jgi:DNA (cytosine-5)-methyltransferase 1
MVRKLSTIAANSEFGLPTFIDLFCGCGGFTLGMLRAGFHCAAAIDLDGLAVSTLRKNVASVPNVLQRDLTKFRAPELAALIGTDRVDVIVGGPPCQGFSTARQVDGSNHGPRLTADPRRYLYREFLKYVEFFQPRVFVRWWGLAALSADDANGTTGSS